MKRLQKIIIIVCFGFFVAGAASLLTSSRYPSCDLVQKGVGVSTYGCIGSGTETDEPCQAEVANSSAMKSCFHDHYYKSRTFPFGFTQYFGDDSDEADNRLLYLNSGATFASTILVTSAIWWFIERESGKYTALPQVASLQ